MWSPSPRGIQLDSSMYNSRCLMRCLTPRLMQSKAAPSRVGNCASGRAQASGGMHSTSTSTAETCYMTRLSLKGRDDGILKGATVVIKDSYDIQGLGTSNGSPTWLAAHPAASQNAPAVQALLDAGVTITGKCIMDEMAYSLEGSNAHYGTPVNPACPDRLPGGSSSGTAAAVAAGEADLGLGGDTGGSVRVPASFCGILGIRPTHGRVDLTGSCPLAPSFDTGGWFARDPALLRKAGQVLLPPSSKRPVSLKRWLVGKDAFDIATPATSRAIYDALSPKIDGMQQLLSPPQEIDIGRGLEGGLRSWAEIFRIDQGYEAWQTHGQFIEQHRPALGPGIKERFEMASKITAAEYDEAHKRRKVVTAHMHELLGDDAVLAVPSAPGPAPLVNSSPEEISAMRSQLLPLTCIAGLAGLPQVSLPIAQVDGCPVGLGLIGPPGSDEALLALTEEIMGLLKAS